MRFKALNTFTGKLPLISRMDPFPKIGSNTEESIQSGVMNGVLAETEGIINQYKEKFPGLKVILCGGDAGFFESKIKETIFVVADLVLVGLNTILLHNVSED
jgi:type III pantothenate kinase